MVGGGGGGHRDAAERCQRCWKSIRIPIQRKPEENLVVFVGPALDRLTTRRLIASRVLRNGGEVRGGVGWQIEAHWPPWLFVPAPLYPSPNRRVSALIDSASRVCVCVMRALLLCRQLYRLHSRDLSDPPIFPPPHPLTPLAPPPPPRASSERPMGANIFQFSLFLFQ